jgi:eukaryotic-like serine/threonine-protein kinase
MKEGSTASMNGTETARRESRAEIRTAHAGRYRIYDEIAVGGMASVHLGRLIGPAGFARTVAIKRLHPAYARDPHFVTMFIDEARTAARVRHPNVVPIVDVIATDNDLLSIVGHVAGVSLQSSRKLQGVRGELLLVMDYVPGLALSSLLELVAERGERMPPAIASAIVAGLLHGLAAAHEATSESGEPLGIVHRDVSPQNTMVGADGITRVVDFGIAYAANRVLTTKESTLKGKLGYMAPERVHGGETRQSSDLYSAAVVLWEMLVGRRLFKATTEAGLLELVMMGDVEAPGKHAPGLPAQLDSVVVRALHHDPAERFATARDLARAIDESLPAASTFNVSAYVKSVAADQLATRASRLAEIESEAVTPSTPPETEVPIVSGVVTRPTVPEGLPRGPWRHRWLATAGAGALACGLVAVFFAPRRRSVDDTASPLRAEAPPISLAVPASSAAADTRPDASPSRDSASATETRSDPASPATPAAHAGRASHAPDCRVPFVVDASGKRVYKRACLR